MKQKTLITAATSTLVATLAVAGITYAATPAGNNTSLLNQGTVEVDSIKVGSTGSGGVTFFNGTIVNEGTQTPVTFGDDVRVDGRIWRGENQGPALGDNKPFIINDDTQVAGSFTVGGTDIFAAIDAKADKSLVTTNTTNISSNDTDIAANTTAISNNASNISNKADSSDVASNTSAIALKANTADVVTKAAPEWTSRLGFETVHGSAFAPPSSDNSSGYVRTEVSGFGLQNVSGGSQTYIAPLRLPHNATISKLSMLVQNNTADDISLSLNSYEFEELTIGDYNSSLINHVSLTDSNNDTDTHRPENTTINTPLINTEARHYFLEAELVTGSTSQTLISAQVLYTYTQPY